MQRVASVKSVLLEKKDGADDDDTRSPESVERVWTDEVDGAWAKGKAPVQLLTALLQHVQDDDVAQAELTAREILVVEPQNQLVQDLLAAMKLREEMDATLESASESDESESDDSDDDNESDGSDESASNDDECGDESREHDAAADQVARLSDSEVDINNEEK